MRWMGGNVPLGYDAEGRTLKINAGEAATIRMLFDLYDQHGMVGAVTREAARLELRSKLRTGRDGASRGGSLMGRGQIHAILANPVYAGRIRHKQLVHDGQHDAIIDPERWEAVQARLTAASAKPRGPSVASNGASHPSPLAGKLFDETGDRMTPSHANKKGRRYRYYVSQRLVSGTREDHSGWRLPARRLEQDLASAVLHYLTRAIHQGAIQVTGAGELQRLQAAVAEPYATGLTLIERVDLATDKLRIRLDRPATIKVLGLAEHAAPPEVMMFSFPAKLRRRGVEARFVIDDAAPERDDIQIANIARAEAWR